MYLISLSSISPYVRLHLQVICSVNLLHGRMLFDHGAAALQAEQSGLSLEAFVLHAQGELDHKLHLAV